MSALRDKLSMWRERSGRLAPAESATAGSEPPAESATAGSEPPAESATAGSEPARSADGSDRARAFWDEKHARDVTNRSRSKPDLDPIDYTQHWLLYNLAVSRPLTGDCAKYWLDEIGSRYLRPPPARMLSLGCGPAFIEEQILERDFAGTIVAYDTSEVAVESARRRLASTPWIERMDLRCGDALTADIPDGCFDAVFVEAALHHFVALEPTFRLMHRVLRPGGLLVFDEYVGPDLQQYPPELEALLGRINACLAPNLRRDFETGEVREAVEACSLDVQFQRDPTEGVHASEILPLTYRFFDVIERRDYGGAIMRPLFNRILLNWDFENDPKDQTIAQLIVLLEQELLRHGAIPTHNTVVVARPRTEPLAPLRPELVERIAYADWEGLDSAREPVERRGAPTPRVALGEPEPGG